MFMQRHRMTSLGLALLCSVGAHAGDSGRLNYTVQPGDRLETLARDLMADPQAWRSLARLNGLNDANRLRPGQRLALPQAALKETTPTATLVAVSGSVVVNDRQAQTGQPIAEGDRIATGDNSSAVLRLADGTRVQLLPASLGELLQHRQFEPQNTKPTPANTWYTGTLRLIQGALQTLTDRGVLRAAPLEIKTPTSVVGVRGTHFRVGFEGQARSEVLSGTVNAENSAQGSEALLPAGTGAVINPAQARIDIKPLLAAPDLPPDLPPLAASEAWRWPTVPGAAGWRVQVARDAAFDRIVAAYPLDRPELAPGSIPAGNWYVRVRAVDADGLEGFDAVRSLRALAAVPWGFEFEPLAYQAGGSELAWRAVDLQGRPVPVATWSLTWDSRDPSATATAPVTVRNDGPLRAVATLPPLPSGSYALRITGTDENQQTVISQRYRLQLPSGWGNTLTNLPQALRAEID